MASNTETGHAKNVANFEDLISFCAAYGATYNPTKAALKVGALNTQLIAANATVQAVKTAKTAYDNATNAREITFKPLKALATKVINAIAATEATAQTVYDVKSSNNKIQGRRAKAVAKPDAKALAEGAEPVRTASTSQQSFDKLIDNFAQLIATLTAEPKYLKPVITFARGSHIIIDARFMPGDAAVMIPKTSDGRVLFCIPWLGHLLVGTTDVPCETAALGEIPTDGEIDFLLETAGAFLA